MNAVDKNSNRAFTIYAISAGNKLYSKQLRSP